MKDFRVTKSSLPDLIQQLEDMLSESPELILSAQTANTGKWGMARLWRAWMATTADFMANNGVTMPLMISLEGEIHGTRPFDQNDAHELFTSHWLGLDADGTRLSWSKSGRDGMRPATKGERFHALRKHEEWCLSKGKTLYNPRGSEYEEMKNKEMQ